MVTAGERVYIGVPEPDLNLDERPPLDARFYFRDAGDGKFEVHHPLHGTVTFGNNTDIENSSIDRAAVTLLRYMPFLMDTRKLNRIRRFETRPYAGEYPELSHCISLGLIGQYMGGGPLEVLDGLWNDTSKIYDAHQGDDNYQGHGNEDRHDQDRASFFVRAGVMDALEEAKALRRRNQVLYLGKTGLSIGKLLDEDEVTVRRTFMSNKHEARRMDADRLQYLVEESLLLGTAKHKGMPSPAKVPLSLARRTLNGTARRIELEGNEGDQLVYLDSGLALYDSIEYVRHNSEHWCEPVQDLVNDLLNLAERYFFLCEHSFAREFQYFYPYDYLHTSATLMFERFEEVAKDNPVMRWLLDTAEKIAADQRNKALLYDASVNLYQGPNPPDGVRLTPLEEVQIQSEVEVENGVFKIKLPKGKVRTLNPRVLEGKRTTPLSAIEEDGIGSDFKDFAKSQQRWIGNYEAEIEINDPELAEQIKTAMEMIDQTWPLELSRRPPMEPGELQLTIREANEFVLNAGRFTLTAA